jgi:glycine cleavage system aminomethyltransferase T
MLFVKEVPVIHSSFSFLMSCYCLYHFKEKGYRDYGHDIDNTDTVLEAGLGFTCDFSKDKGFIGMDHVLTQKEMRLSQGGFTKRMVHVFVNDPQPLMQHGEVLWRDNVRVSDVRMASYGHTLGGAVGLSMIETQKQNSDYPVITKEYLQHGIWEVEIAERRFPCQLSLAPFYDPKSHRIKGMFD